jgi:diacylglycerol kinase family enzyme
MRLKVQLTVAKTGSSSNELVLILNPNSQGGATGNNWDKTYREIREFLPKQHRIIFTKKANDGTSIANKLCKQGYNNIAAVGGDGTINEVANGFFYLKSKNRSALDSVKFKPDSRLTPANPKAACWIIPSGSRNVLAASLGIKHQGIEAFKNMSQMKKSKIDVIVAFVTDKDNPSRIHNRVVLNAAELGMGAEIIDRSKRVRGKIKSRLLSTMAGIVSTLPTYASNECDIVLDNNQKITSKITLAVVANGNFLGGGFNVAPKAKISDGKLDVVVMKNSGSLKMVEKLVEMKGNSDYRREEDILYYQASQVAFLPKSRNITVSLDGEPVGILPAVFKVYHNALNIKSESSRM